MIKLVITDIGGVLIKTDEAIISTIEQIFLENKIVGRDVEGLKNAFGESLFDYIKGYLPRGYKNKSKILYQKFKERYPFKSMNLLKKFRGVENTLVNLRRNHVKIAVLSCMDNNQVKANLSLLKFKNFDIIFSLDDYNFKRPNPYGLLMIIKKLKINRNEVIYIGDTPRDVKMAKNAKIVSVAVGTGALDNSVFDDEQPDYFINSFSEIKELIDLINKN